MRDLSEVRRSAVRDGSMNASRRPAGSTATDPRLDVIARSVVAVGSRSLRRDGIGGNGPALIPELGMPSGDVVMVPNLFETDWLGGRAVNTLQEWQGLVDVVGDDHFVARLKDLTNPDNEDEEARIPLSDVDEADRPTFGAGTLFHLVIGYCRREGGARHRETLIYVRRNVRSTDRTGSELAELLAHFADEG